MSGQVAASDEVTPVPVSLHDFGDKVSHTITGQFDATYYTTEDDDRDDTKRGSVRPVLKFGRVNQKWSVTHDRVRKIYFSKDVPNQAYGAVQLTVRRDWEHGEVLLTTPIRYPQRGEWVRNWGKVYVEFKAIEVPAGRINEIYVHVEWY